MGNNSSNDEKNTPKTESKPSNKELTAVHRKCVKTFSGTVSVSNRHVTLTFIIYRIFNLFLRY